MDNNENLKDLINEGKITIQDLFKDKNLTFQNSFKNIPESNYIIKNPLKDAVMNYEDIMKNINEKVRKDLEKKEKYDQEVLNTLKNIEMNMANLASILNLIREGNEKQNEIYEIIVELLALAKETNKQEIESKYRKIMNKITSFTDDIETMTTLATFAATVFNFLKGLIK